MGKATRGRGSRASRRRAAKASRQTILGLLTALLTALVAWAITYESNRAGRAVKRGAERAVPKQLKSARQSPRFKKSFVLAFLTAAVMIGGPAAPTANAAFGLSPQLMGRAYDWLPRAAAEATEVPLELSQVVAGAGITPTPQALAAAQAQQEPRMAALPPSQPPLPTPPPPPPPPAQPVRQVAPAVYSAVQAGPNAIWGIATWYGGVDGFDRGDGMADGTPFDPDDPTITASNMWPLGTRLLVCHGERCIQVVVRDRGGFRHALDLSRAAFAMLAPLSSGVIEVRIEVVS